MPNPWGTLNGPVTVHVFPRTVSFTSYDTAKMTPIGYGILLNVNHYHQTAELGNIIGDKPYWGQGCGMEAIYMECLSTEFMSPFLHLVA